MRNKARNQEASGRRYGDHAGLTERDSCETNPSCGLPRGTGILPVDQEHGQDAHATSMPYGVTTNEAAAPNKAKGR